MMKRTICIFAATLIAVFALYGPAKPAHASFDQNDIIDASIFDNPNTMNQASIQNFLNGFPSSCLSNYQTPQIVDYFNYNDGTSLNGTSHTTFRSLVQVPAANAIYTAAQAWSLNPQVILATLEKEESLVTGGAGCASWRYNTAMGYACPDSGSCPTNAYQAGFSRQVMQAAWQLRFNEQRSVGNTGWDGDGSTFYSGYMTQGTFARVAGGSTAFYDGTASIDGVTVTMSNGPTASLYSYTPHFHGNQVFVSLFEQWFGSTKSTYLAKGTASSTVYVISDGSKYLIGNSDMLGIFSGVFGPVHTVTQSFIDGLTAGSPISRLALSSSSGGVYILDGGSKYQFTTCRQVTDYGYSCPAAVSLPDDVLNAFFTGPNLSSQLRASDGSVYQISGGQRHWVPDGSTWSSLGLNAQPLLQLSPTFTSSIAIGSPDLVDQSLSFDINTGAAYLYISSALRYIPTTSELLNWRFGVLHTYHIPDSMLTQLSTGTAITPFAQDSHGNKYLMDGAFKKPLGIDAAAYPATYTSLPDALINAVTTGTDPGTLVRSSRDGTIFSIESGAKRYIPSISDISGSGLDPNSVTTLEGANIDPMPVGAWRLGAVRLIKQSGNPLIVMVDGPATGQKIVSSQFAADAGINLANAITVDSMTFNAYPATTTLSELVTDGTNDYLLDGGTKHLFNSSALTNYGYTGTDFQQLNARSISGLPTGTAMTQFLKAAAPTVYYVNNGQRQQIQTLGSYTSLGGNPSNTLTVSSDYLNTIPAGSNIP